MNQMVTTGQTSIVLYCIIRRVCDGVTQFLLMQKREGELSFPCTKYRAGEELYEALVRPLSEDLHLPPGTYFPEDELEELHNSSRSPAYNGLPKSWLLCPVTVSLTEEGYRSLEDRQVEWLTLEQVLNDIDEPNVKVIAQALRNYHDGLKCSSSPTPSMEARACSWAAGQPKTVRVVRRSDIDEIIGAGGRAFNLRVADPYLPYQRQGQGFTWSFFTPKDKQDLHVHGLPAVEIYGVMKGRLQLWTKQMNQRGVRTWQRQILCAGDWAEVEPLTCHFACWLDEDGLGTVIKAAGSGELAGVGRIGTAGKTTCPDCNMKGQCRMPEAMCELMAIYQKPYVERDYDRIAQLSEGME